MTHCEFCGQEKPVRVELTVFGGFGTKQYVPETGEWISPELVRVDGKRPCPVCGMPIAVVEG